jgi:hypothetical protein
MLEQRFKVINRAELKKNFFPKRLVNRMKQPAISFTVLENFGRDRVQSLKIIFLVRNRRYFVTMQYCVKMYTVVEFAPDPF